MVRDDLGERRLVALAVRGGPREGGDVAARLDAHDRALERPDAAHLDVARHADAQQRPVAAAHARLLVPAELLDAGAPPRLRTRASRAPAARARATRRLVWA